MGSEASFFPIPSDTLAADDLDDVPFSTPVWAAPPADLIPGVAGLSVELGRSTDTVVLLEGARAYPHGVELRLVVRFRETHRRAARDLVERLNLHHGRGSLSVALPAGGLRWGVQFADGQKVTSQMNPHGRPPGCLRAWILPSGWSITRSWRPPPAPAPP